MKLNELSPATGSVREAYRKGRGAGSGNGKTAGKGHKGQNARSGGTGHNDQPGGNADGQNGFCGGLKGGSAMDGTQFFFGHRGAGGGKFQGVHTKVPFYYNKVRG